jgi:hypothetical protein
MLSAWWQCRDAHFAATMAMAHKARQTPTFSLIGIDWCAFIAASAWMHNVILATTERTIMPSVDNVEGQWCMHTDGWV